MPRRLPYELIFQVFALLVSFILVHGVYVTIIRPQAEAFIDWVQTGIPAGPDAMDGWNVARILDAAMRSMKNGGVMCPVDVDSNVTGRIASAEVAAVTPKATAAGMGERLEERMSITSVPLDSSPSSAPKGQLNESWVG